VRLGYIYLIHQKLESQRHVIGRKIAGPLARETAQKCGKRLLLVAYLALSQNARIGDREIS
jgi:hypothetical protein